MTSWSDNNKEYKDACKEFIENDAAFLEFRSYNGNYNIVVEHVRKIDADNYLAVIGRDNKHLLDKIELFKKNDLIGKPNLADFGSLGKISTTTIRYIKVLSDIMRMRRCEEKGSIIEIGGGYGGQARILMEFFTTTDYTMVDLAEVLPLQIKYLRMYGKEICAVSPEMVKSISRSYDFCVSNFAFNECSKETQELYIDKIISKSKHGYISGVFTGVNGMSCDEVTGSIPGCIVRDYEPDIGFGCKIIEW